MLSSGANVIIWDVMLSSGMQCYHPGQNFIVYDEMLSSLANVMMCGTKCYHLGRNVIIRS